MITIKKLGVGKVNSPKYTSVISNKEIATHFIGDVASPYKSGNILVNEKQLEQLMNEISEIVGTAVQNERSSEVLKPLLANENTLHEEYIKYLHSANNSATKAGLIKFCEEHNVKLPENTDELKLKDYLDIIFPELKQ